MEKAHPDVLNLFYQVFDEECSPTARAPKIDFKNTVVFLTSNLATDGVIVSMTRDRCPLDRGAGQRHPADPLQAHFKPALLARMEIVPCAPLRGENLKSIVRLKLRGIGESSER
ncbi:MAG: AAA family ATPase [Candidatus Eisenbacteria bacterium]